MCFDIYFWPWVVIFCLTVCITSRVRSDFQWIFCIMINSNSLSYKSNILNKNSNNYSNHFKNKYNHNYCTVQQQQYTCTYSILRTPLLLYKAARGPKNQVVSTAPLPPNALKQTHNKRKKTFKKSPTLKKPSKRAFPLKRAGDCFIMSFFHPYLAPDWVMYHLRKGALIFMGGGGGGGRKLIAMVCVVCCSLVPPHFTLVDSHFLYHATVLVTCSPPLTVKYNVRSILCVYLTV